MDNCSGLTRTTPKYTLVKARYSNCCNCLEQTHGKRGPDTGRIQMLSPHRVLWMLYERASTNKNQRKENINSKSHKPRPNHDLSPRSQRYVGDAMWPLARTNRGGPPVQQPCHRIRLTWGAPPAPHTIPDLMRSSHQAREDEDAKSPLSRCKHISTDIMNNCCPCGKTCCSSTWCKSPERRYPEKKCTKTCVLM